MDLHKFHSQKHFDYMRHVVSHNITYHMVSHMAVVHQRNAIIGKIMKVYIIYVRILSILVCLKSIIKKQWAETANVFLNSTIPIVYQKVFTVNLDF